MIDTLIFDLGGVVVREKTPDLWKTVFERIATDFSLDEKKLHHLLKNHLEDIQTGRMTLLDFYTRAAEKRKDITPQQLLDFHFDQYKKYSTEDDPAMLAFIHALRKTYHVVCLTNTEPEIAEFNAQRGLFNHFERAFISTDIHLRKPHAEVYLSVLHELHIPPHQGVFIDNSADYVTAAQRVGLKGIVYTSLSQLKQDLVVIGVSLPK